MSSFSFFSKELVNELSEIVSGLFNSEGFFSNEVTKSSSFSFLLLELFEFFLFSGVFFISFVSLFLYYVSAFCAVYRNSQIYWFIGCLESFGIDSFVAVAICFLLTLFRYIAIKKRIKCFYILANIISTFL